MTGGQHGQTHLRNDACDRHSIVGVCDDVHGAAKGLPGYLREELEQAELQLHELLRRGAAAVSPGGA
jgi:hypothetical protein